ncbi:hypothetical protein Cgig2_009910 [Carnegiea gigantea]|uniref:NAD(P)-binding domain-containing protein n=1 Tax=Carnegiea gigantea TaxID=171969 RepID=A0A9Q1K4N0_9CARY|nr:hypothetical protein Cgig2_009910 [Carnegiea gigantea]
MEIRGTLRLRRVSSLREGVEGIEFKRSHLMISECIDDLTRESQPPVNPITLEDQSLRLLLLWFDNVACHFTGVRRFVYISAADFGLVNYILQGYYEGKRAAETELLTRFPYGGVILRPGFIYGTRRVGSMKLPLGIIGSPLEMILQHARPLTQVPLVGPLFTPPVSVQAVAKVAVRAATDPVFPPGIIDVHGILRYSGHQKK